MDQQLHEPTTKLGGSKGRIEFLSPKALRYRKGSESIRFQIAHKDYPGTEGAVLIFCPKELAIEESSRQISPKEFKGIRADIVSELSEIGAVGVFLAEVKPEQYPNCPF